MRFLISRRWVLFALIVVLSMYLAWILGQWQFHRLTERKHSNRVVATNLADVSVPVDELMSVRRQPGPDDEWKRVTIHGQWDDRHSVVLKYQTRDSSAGVDVVTPLVTEKGAAVLVDRGWMATANSGGTRPKLPKVSADQVTVTGYLRRNATGGATRVSDLSTRAVSSETVGKILPYPVYAGFVDLADETPPPAQKLEPVELPDDTSDGPHFFYGLQWWFFGVLAVTGFGYFAYDEWRRRKQERQDHQAGVEEPVGAPGPEPDSERPEHASVDGKHHAGHEA